MKFVILLAVLLSFALCITAEHPPEHAPVAGAYTRQIEAGRPGLVPARDREKYNAWSAQRAAADRRAERSAFRREQAQTDLELRRADLELRRADVDALRADVELKSRQMMETEADQDSTKSLSKSALDDYVIMLRREANLLTTDINIDTRRGFLRNVENSIKYLNEAQREFEERNRLYSTQDGKGRLVTRLRHALAARTAVRNYHNAVQVSRVVMGEIVGYTRTHADAELREQRSLILEYMGALVQHLDATIEALLHEIEHKLKTTNP